MTTLEDLSVLARLREDEVSERSALVANRRLTNQLLEAVEFQQQLIGTREQPSESTEIGGLGLSEELEFVLLSKNSVHRPSRSFR